MVTHWSSSHTGEVLYITTSYKTRNSPRKQVMRLLPQKDLDPLELEGPFLCELCASELHNANTVFQHSSVHHHKDVPLTSPISVTRPATRSSLTPPCTASYCNAASTVVEDVSYYDRVPNVAEFTPERINTSFSQKGYFEHSTVDKLRFVDQPTGEVLTATSFLSTVVKCRLCEYVLGSNRHETVMLRRINLHWARERTRVSG